MALRFSVSASGGALYHLIAARRSRKKWRSFRGQVREWLSLWRTDKARELIVFGPSAGWTLPLDLLAKSKRLTIVEPDPLARQLLAFRLRSSGAQMQTIEWLSDARLLPWFSRSESDFQTFLAARPNADILFANVLGQIALHFTIAQKKSVLHSQTVFAQALATRRWASYHDLYSGPRPEQAPNLNRLSVGESPDVSKIFTKGTVTDHETDWLSALGPTELSIWPFTDAQVHVIGFVQAFHCLI